MDFDNVYFLWDFNLKLPSFDNSKNEGAPIEVKKVFLESRIKRGILSEILKTLFKKKDGLKSELKVGFELNFSGDCVILIST